MLYDFYALLVRNCTRVKQQHAAACSAKSRRGSYARFYTTWPICTERARAVLWLPNIATSMSNGAPRHTC